MVAPLKQVTCRVHAFLNEAGVAGADPLHEFTQRSVGDLHQQRHLVRHPAGSGRVSSLAFEARSDDKKAQQDRRRIRAWDDWTANRFW